MIDTKEVEKGITRHVSMQDAARMLSVRYATLRAYAARHGLTIRIPMDHTVYLRVEDVERLQRERAKLNKI